MKLTPKAKAWVDQLTWEELVDYMVKFSGQVEARGEAREYLISRWWKLKQERQRRIDGPD